MIQVLLRAAPLTSMSGSLSLNADTGTYVGGADVIWPCAGTFRNLVVNLAAAPGTGNTRTFTLYINGVATALTVTHGAAVTTARDTANDVAIAAGDRVRVLLASTGAPSAFGALTWSLEFDSNDTVTSAYGAQVNNSGFVDPFTARNSGTATDCQRLIPCDGTITRLAGVNTFTNVSPTQILDCFVYKNGVKQDGTGGTVDTRLRITNVSQNVPVLQDFSLPVARGDRLYIGMEASGGYGSQTTLLGMTFAAAVPGEAIVATIAGSAPSNSAVRYGSLQTTGDGWASATTGLAYVCGPTPLYLRNLLLQVANDPAAGTRTYDVLLNGAASAMQAVVTTGALLVDGSTEIAVVDGDAVGPMRHTPASTPTVTGNEWWSFVISASQAPADPPDPTAPAEPTGTIEMCFGLAPSGKPGYRNWIKEHASVVAHWYLSDVGLPGAYGAEDEIQPNDAGLYFGTPFKQRGMLPEFGMSTAFDGINDYVEVDYDFFGLGANDPFTFAVLVSPTAVTSASARCIHQSGTTGGYLAIDATGHFQFGANGGTVITLTQAVTALDDYLVVARYDGTNARLSAYSLTTARASNPKQLGELLGSIGPTAVSIGPHGGSDAYIGQRSSSQWFDGRIQGLACFSVSLSDDDVAALLECCTWTDVSADCRAEVPIETASGLFDDAPDTRIAPVGACTFGLNNAEDNEGALLGWYSPDHANRRTGFTRGIAVRATLASQTDASLLFIGRLAEIKPETGRYANRVTHCIAYDWMEEAARFNLQGIETQENVTADEVLLLILSRMENKPHAINLDTGSDTYPVALDDAKDESAYAQSEFDKLMMSEMGLLYITAGGVLTFENRTHRAALTTSLRTIDNGMWSADADASVSQIINHVRAVVHPRRVDAAPTTVLYQSSNRLALDGGTTVTSLQFRDPAQQAKRFGGLDVVTPAPTTHYTLNTVEDGSGTDVTGNPNIAITFEISGSAVTMTTVNNYGQRVFIDIEVLGKGVYNYEPVTIIEKNDDSIKAIGISGVVLDMPYQTSVPTGQGAAQQVLSVFQSELTRLRAIEIPAHKSYGDLSTAIETEITDRITVLEEVAGINREFFVNGRKVTWQRDRAITLLLSLTPADMAEYWILGTSELGTSTRLGFA